MAKVSKEAFDAQRAAIIEDTKARNQKLGLYLDESKITKHADERMRNVERQLKIEKERGN